LRKDEASAQLSLVGISALNSLQYVGTAGYRASKTLSHFSKGSLFKQIEEENQHGTSY